MLTIEQAKEHQEEYQARPEIRKALGGTTLLAFIGPAAVGKNYLMHASEFPVVTNETSRQPRTDDNPALYTYTPLEDMLEAIERKELVQYGAFLPNTMYGTRLHDYELDETNVKDIWHDAVGSLYNKGYKEIKTVGVMVPPVQFMSQMRMRFEGADAGNIAARLDEARHSLRWNVSRHMTRAANHLLVINDALATEENIERIRAFADGEVVKPHADEKVIDLQDEMFKSIKLMYSRIGIEY